MDSCPRFGHRSVVQGFQEALQVVGITGLVHQLGNLVENLEEQLVPGQIADEDQSRLGVGGLPAETKRPFGVETGQDERKVLHRIAAKSQSETVTSTLSIGNKIRPRTRQFCTEMQTVTLASAYLHL